MGYIASMAVSYGIRNILGFQHAFRLDLADDFYQAAIALSSNEGVPLGISSF